MNGSISAGTTKLDSNDRRYWVCVCVCLCQNSKLLWETWMRSILDCCEAFRFQSIRFRKKKWIFSLFSHSSLISDEFSTANSALNTKTVDRKEKILKIRGWKIYNQWHANICWFKFKFVSSLFNEVLCVFCLILSFAITSKEDKVEWSEYTFFFI